MSSAKTMTTIASIASAIRDDGSMRRNWSWPGRRYGAHMRGLLAIRVILLLGMLGCAVLWRLRIVADVPGPLLLLCSLVIITYRQEPRRVRLR